ncbi:MAG: signal transduction histidine kinase, nitrogen specific, NtrB [Firmicutes bacterium]|nr:signal transduction histidine kinase, nitrogen specific, NtrB [Bacillota bacterium]
MGLERLIVGELAFPVQHRILNIVLLLGICLATLSCVFFSLFRSGTILLFVSVTSAVTLISFYYLLFKRKNYTHTAFLAIIIFGFAVVPLMWIFRGGIYGGTPFYTLMYAAMITTLLRGKSRLVVLICFVIMLSVLIIVQFFNPSFIIVPFIGDKERYLELFFSLLIAMVTFIAFFMVILNHYTLEYQKSRTYLSQLEKQKMEIELDRLDRLNLIGEMAASIGHEVRNPLTTVRGYLQLFKQQQAFSNYQERFDIMIGELDRANLIITEFLSLAKNKTVHRKRANLNIIIGNIQLLLHADALLQGKKLTIELEDIPDLLLDENEIRQCILNFVRNAFEATGNEGIVVLKTYIEDNEVVLSVQDNGEGIPPEVYAKLGTPFLTTKHQGTGLGLPVCYRIADRHQAKIEVKNSPSGATFSIKFSML